MLRRDGWTLPAAPLGYAEHEIGFLRHTVGKDSVLDFQLCTKFPEHGEMGVEPAPADGIPSGLADHRFTFSYEKR